MICSVFEQVLRDVQLAVLFLWVPIPALLLAFSFLDDKEDDCFGGEISEPEIEAIGCRREDFG